MILTMKDTDPSKLPLRFLAWFCRPEYYLDIEGDLLELYDRYRQENGTNAAKWLLWKDVLLLFRPGIIRPIRPLKYFNLNLMLRHNLLLTFRSFQRYKSFFLINLIGLATGLACAILIYLWVNDELRVDKFHEKDEWIYQVLEHRKHDGGIWTDDMTSGPMAKALKAEFPEVEHATAVGPASWPGFDNFTLSVGEQNTRGGGHFVGPDFFQIFSYKLTEGNSREVLSDKNSILLSERMAMNLFGTTTDLLDKVVEFQHEQQFTISGIFENIPPNATDRFDFILSYEVLREMKPWVDNWGSTGPKVYLTLQPDTDVEQFNQKLLGFAKSRTNGEELSRIPFVQRYSDLYLHGKYQDGQLVGGRIEYVRLFSYIALFILLIGCINFMNLSTAKASRKMTEIGVKKVVGAGRGTLMIQYLGESLLMAFISLALALGLVLLSLPQFNQITGKQLLFDWTWTLLLPLVGITFLVGIISGSYPALYLSGFQPLQVFRGHSVAGRGEIWSRRGLVTFQFTLTIILMVAVIVTYHQIRYIQNKDIGFQKENVLWLDAEGKLKEEVEPFLSNIKNIPGVINASATSHRMVGHNWSMRGMEWPGSPPENQINFEIVGVDYEFIETMDIELKTGRSFSEAFGAEADRIIFNETAIQAMGMEDPIGEKVNFFMGEKEIIGVVKDFHFESLHQEVGPLFMVLFSAQQGLNKIMIRISGDQTQNTIASIREIYETYNPGFTFTYRFLDETYQQQYLAEQRVAVLSRYFAGLAILISCLGLFGLASFTAEKRRKEIGIRKVLGASTWKILLLLSREFSRIVLVAVLIAFPIGFLVTNHWLDGFAYRIELEWWFFVLSAVTVLFIAWFTVGVQALKADNANLMDALRDT